MKRILLVFIIILLVVSDLDAQRRNGLIRRRIESSGFLMLGMGPAVLFGEPGSAFNNMFENGIHNWDMSLGFRHRLPGGNFSYMVNFDYGNYAGTDKGSYLDLRGYSNISNVMELAARGEYTYFFGGRYARINPHGVYAFLGSGALYSNTTYTGQKPGGNDYANPIYAAIIHYGVGYQYQMDVNWFIGAEIGSRFVFSDFVDGFHSVRYSKSNDVITGIKFTVAYKIF